jgi:predicted nucleic acid-binding protein
MIVVLDTNIVASATFWRGKPAHCLEAWGLGKYDLATSHPILTEYEEIIDRLAARYPTKQPTDWLGAITGWPSVSSASPASLHRRSG